MDAKSRNLSESLANSLVLMDVISEGLLLVNSKGEILLANARIETLFGYRRDELIGQPLEMVVPHEFRSGHLQQMQQYFADPHVRPMTGPSIKPYCLRKDGTQFPARIGLGHIEYDGVMLVSALISDVTELESARLHEKESDEHYRSLFNHVPVGLYRTTPEGRIDDANPALLEMLGYESTEQLKAVNLYELYVDPKERDRQITLIQEHGFLIDFDIQLRHSNGSILTVRDSMQAIRDENGAITAYEGSLRDITDRKLAEQALLKSEEQYRILAEAANDLIFVVDREGVVEYVNATAASQFRLPVEKIVGRKMESLFPSEIGQRQLASIQRIFETQKVHFAEGLAVFPNGEMWLGTSLSPLFDDDGEVRAVLGVSRDITQRKLTEEAERDQRIMAEALRETAESLNRSLDYKSVLDRILDISGRVVPHDAATVLLIEDGNLSLARSQGYEERGLVPENFVRELDLQTTANLKEMFESKQPVLISDVGAYPDWQLIPGAEWLRSDIGAPLIVQGEVIGFLLLDSETPDFFTPTSRTATAGICRSGCDCNSECSSIRSSTK